MRILATLYVLPEVIQKKTFETCVQYFRNSACSFRNETCLIMYNRQVPGLEKQ